LKILSCPFVIVIHLSTLNSFAFIATIIVLNDINTAPTAGLKTIPAEYKTPAASGIAITLYPVAQIKFCTILLYVAFANFINETTSLGLLLTRIISAVSTATSVPAPMAIPTSA
jgi:hypothetical protein